MSTSTAAWRVEHPDGKSHKNTREDDSKDKINKTSAEEWLFSRDENVRNAVSGLKRLIEVRSRIYEFFISIEGEVATYDEIRRGIDYPPDIIKKSLNKLLGEGILGRRTAGTTEIWWLEGEPETEYWEIPESLNKALEDRKKPNETIRETLSSIKGNPNEELLREIFSSPSDSAEEFREAIERKKEKTNRSELRDHFK